MGESKSSLFQPDFNRSVHVEARPERLSGDAGALVLREIFSCLGMDDFFRERLKDPRASERVVHPQSELMRTELLRLTQGFADQCDADALRDDPVFRLSVSDRRGSEPLRSSGDSGAPDGLASQPTLSRFHRTLSSQLEVLREGLLELAARRIRSMNRGHRHRYATIDLDSVPIEVHGQQPGSAYNGHFGYRCYHPLVASLGEQGDLLDVRLRPGNAHTANGGLDFLLALIDRVEESVCQVASVRMDAGFPGEQLLSALEARRVGYVARIRSNPRLDKLAAPKLAACPTSPPEEGERLSFHELSYKADSWSAPRRVVLVIRHDAGELFPERFFLITSWNAEQMPPEVLLGLYRKRGMAENHHGELKDVLDPALSATARPKSHYRGQEPASRSAAGDPFAINEVRLLLNALAYNLLHVARALLEKQTRQGWSLRRLRQRILRQPARVLLHARGVQIIISRAASQLWSRLVAGVLTLRGSPAAQIG